MPTYPFRADDGQVKDFRTKKVYRTGDRMDRDGKTWTRLACAPPRRPLDWSEGAGTATPFYSHMAGRMVSSIKEEERIAASKGLVRATDEDLAAIDRRASEREAEEDKLINTPLPDLADLFGPGTDQPPT